MRKYVLLALVAFGIAITAYSVAFAGQNCTTHCNRNPLTGQETCNTYCY